MRGAPHLAVKNADGAELGLGWIDNMQAQTAPKVVPAPVVVLAPDGGAATTTLYWYLDWCAPDPNPVTVSVLLPADGATVDASPSGGWEPPRCQNQPGSAGGRGEVSSDPLAPE